MTVLSLGNLQGFISYETGRCGERLGLQKVPGTVTNKPMQNIEILFVCNSICLVFLHAGKYLYGIFFFP